MGSSPGRCLKRASCSKPALPLSLPNAERKSITQPLLKRLRKCSPRSTTQSNTLGMTSSSTASSRRLPAIRFWPRSWRLLHPPCTTSAGKRSSVRPTCANRPRSEEHTSELQSRRDLVCRLLLEKKKKKKNNSKPRNKKQKKNKQK